MKLMSPSKKRVYTTAQVLIAHFCLRKLCDSCAQSKCRVIATSQLQIQWQNSHLILDPSLSDSSLRLIHSAKQCRWVYCTDPKHLQGESMYPTVQFSRQILHYFGCRGREGTRLIWIESSGWFGDLSEMQCLARQGVTGSKKGLGLSVRSSMWKFFGWSIIYIMKNILIEHSYTLSKSSFASAYLNSFGSLDDEFQLNRV